MNYLKIDKEDVCNGEGLRVVLWLSGCSHKCKGCQNPQTWDANSGIPFDESAKEELFRELNKDYISGLTLTGGDPLHEENLDGVLDLVNEIRLSRPQKSIWLYTGYTFEEIVHPALKCNQSRMRKIILKNINVLVDGRYIDSERDLTLHWRGSLNQRIWKKTKEGEWVIYQ